MSVKLYSPIVTYIFTYLGSVVKKEESLLEDVKSQIKKAYGVFVQLYPT